jgi:hypothetical protein
MNDYDKYYELTNIKCNICKINFDNKKMCICWCIICNNYKHICKNKCFIA